MHRALDHVPGISAICFPPSAFERNQQPLQLILLVRMQEREAFACSLSRLARAEPISRVPQTSCGALDFVMDAPCSTSRPQLPLFDPEQSHGPSPRLELPCRPLVARATRARRINCCPGALRLSRHLGVLNAGRADRLQQPPFVWPPVSTASSAKDYADVNSQSHSTCAHANSPTAQKQHAGDDRAGGSREKLR